MVTPNYIPPHLQGQISDMRQEPGGGVSFAHPAGNMGAPDQESARIRLGPDETRATFDQSYRGTHPDFMDSEYMPSRPVPMGERMERGVAGWLKNKSGILTGTPARNVMTSGLLGALAGGVGGAYMASRNGTPMLDKSVLFALLGGAGAAGVSALLQRGAQNTMAASGMPITKQASVFNELAQDPSLTEQQKLMLGEAISGMPEHNRHELESLLAQAAGGGVGLLIAKYLGLRGFLSPLLAALIGAGIGNSMTQHHPQFNGYGQPVYD